MNADRGIPWPALVVGPLLAAAVYAISLWGTFLSDDFLMNSMLTRDDPPQVSWGEIFADFARSWAGVEGTGLYRPLVSVSFGLSYALGGHAPMGFHAVNIGLHVLASLACALLCGRLGAGAPGRAAALGGAIFALHPVAAEPVCWIASRTTGLQVMCAAFALAFCAGYLRARRRGAGVATLVFLVAGLMSKEAAVVLPPSFVLLDLMLRLEGRRPLAWRLHAWSFGILAAYFALRLTLFGALVGGSEPGSELLRGHPVDNLLAKFEMLLMPVGGGLPAPWGLAAGCLTAAGTALLLIPNLFRRGLWILGGVAWMVLFFAPTYQLTVDANTLVGSRMVYGASLAFATTLALAAARPVRATRTDRAGAALLLAGLTALVAARVHSYVQSYRDMAALQQQLAAPAARATPGKPIAFVSVNPRPLGIPFLNCNALFPLLEKPVTAKDVPAISLGFIFQEVPDSEDLLFDVGPLRAMRGQGAILVDWLQTQLATWPATPVGITLPELTRHAPTPAWFVAGTAVDPGGVEMVEVEVTGPCSGGRIEWLLTTDGDPQHARAYADLEIPPMFAAASRSAPFGAGERRGDRTVFRIDVSHNLSLLAIGLSGQLAGIHVLPEDGATPVAVRLRPRLAPLPLPQTLHDAVIPLPDTGARWRSPALPEGCTEMSLYLVGPDTTRRLVVPPDAPVRLDSRTVAGIRLILRSSRQGRFYYYFEATGSGTARSEVDWLRFVPR